MLSLLDQQEVCTRGDLAAHVHPAFDFRHNPWMKSMGLDRELADGALTAKAWRSLFSRGWVLDQELLLISDVGREYLKKHGKDQRKRSVARTPIGYAVTGIRRHNP